LNDEAVEACPPSAGYRLRKYVRRNRRALVMVGVVAASLIAATLISTWQAVVARDAQHEAEADRNSAKTAETQAKAAEKRAETEAAIARAVNEFLQQDLLEEVDSAPQGFEEKGGSPYLTVKEALDRAAARIGDRFRDQPLVEAAIRTTIGIAYNRLNAPPQIALAHLQQAVALRQAHLGADHADTLSSMRRLADTCLMLGRHFEAINSYEKLAGNYERLLGPCHATTRECRRALAGAYGNTGQCDRAILLATQLLESSMTEFGATHPESLHSMHTLAMVYLDAGQLTESLEWHQKALSLGTEIQGRDSCTWIMRTYSRTLQRAEHSWRQLTSATTVRGGGISRSGSSFCPREGITRLLVALSRHESSWRGIGGSTEICRG
jgi:hypothetical protein